MLKFNCKKEFTLKKTFILGLALLVASCATPHKSREVASVTKDLTGTYLGVADYKFGHKGPNKAASRIYFHPIENEPGSYHVVLLEYVNLLGMAPDYIISNKAPKLAKKIGFLNSITSKIWALKANPTDKEGVFELWPLVVQGDQIVEKKDGKPRILTLSSDDGLESPLAGATISGVTESDPVQFFFPTKDDDKINGAQYGIAKLTYSKAKLESTWRKNFLSGPYLSQYANVDDVVLDLTKAGDENKAEFKINEAYSKMPKKKREKIFTNKKSAFLKGEFNVSEPLDGMFLFQAVNADNKSIDIIKGKIGLFIDVFDATKSLNQDVVELALIDSEKPEDFLMYYEHPENGEGN